jgi:phosphate transport system substrate-binding protein
MKALSKYAIIGIIFGILIISIIGYIIISQQTSNTPTSTSSKLSINPVSITAGGSTFINPAMQVWINDFTSSYPQIQITYSAVGSGAGVNGFLQGVYDIGATDVPPPSDVYSQLTQKYGQIITIPDVVGAVDIIYNIPSFSGILNLTPDILAQIYLGKIQYWDDPAIQNLNPNFKFPHAKITAVHRSDGSGTTFIFTYWLFISSRTWKDSGIGYGYTVNWPVDQLGNGLAGKGSDGVTAYVQQNAYSIGYVEAQYAIKNNLRAAAVLNPSTGEYVIPTQDSIRNAISNANISNLPPATKDLSKYLSVFLNVNARNAYPIVSFSWLVVKTNYDNKDKAIAIYLFLKYIATNGQGKLPVGYLPLPDNIKQYVLNSIKLISYNNNPVYQTVG